MRRIEDAIAELQRALTRLREATSDDPIDEIDAEVERTISLARFTAYGFVASLVTPMRKRLEGAVEGRFKRRPSSVKTFREGDGPGDLPGGLTSQLRSLGDKIDALAR